MGINCSVPNDNRFSYRDIIHCIKESNNIHNSLKLIFNKSTDLNIEDYFDDTNLNCSYESKEEEFKLYFTCLDCGISNLCPFCFVVGDHVKHKFKRELLNLSICSCVSTSKNKCLKHKSSTSIDYSIFSKDENNQSPHSSQQLQTQLNNSKEDKFLVPGYKDYKNIVVYLDSSAANLKELLKVKNEIHLFIRYIIIFLLGKPLRPNSKESQLYVGYNEVLKFLNYCARRSKFISNVIALEFLSTNIDLESILDCDSTGKTNISLKDIMLDENFTKEIRKTIKLKSTDKSLETKKHPSKLSSDMGDSFIKGSSESAKQLANSDKVGDINNSGSKSSLVLGNSYMCRFNQFFTSDLKEAHIDLFSTLIDRSKTFKVFFYRHFFNIHSDEISATRYDLYMLDKFYNDQDLVSIWVEKSGLIKDLLFSSAKFSKGYCSFDSIRFLPDIIRTNKNAAAQLVSKDLQMLTSLCLKFEDSININILDNNYRIRSIYFTQNIIFTFLYLYKQQTPLDLIKYFGGYLYSLGSEDGVLNHQHMFTVHHYSCLPMLLSAAVIENESGYTKLNLQLWEKALIHTQFLTRYYVLSQISYLNPCKKQATPTLAQFPIQGIEVSATINTLQILSLCNFKMVLFCFFRNPGQLFSTESIVYKSFPVAPIHLTYRFLYTILKSNSFYFDGDCYGSKNKQYKKLLKYHIVNLLYRNIDVPLDLGRSNSVLRNCSEKDIYDTIEEVSTVTEFNGDPVYVKGKSSMKEYDFIATTRVHSSLPSLYIQNNSLVNNHLIKPNHGTRTVKEDYIKYVDDYYEHTNVYHLLYYGFPSANYPLEPLRLNSFDSEILPTKNTPFSAHSFQYLNHTLKQPLLYQLLFRDLLFTVYELSSFTIEGYLPIVQKDITIKSKKISISIDILNIILYIFNYATTKLTSSEIASAKTQLIKYNTHRTKDTSNKQPFKPTVLNSITLLVETYTVTDFNFNNATVYLSIMDLVKEISNLNDSRSQYAQQIMKLYESYIK